MQRRDALLLGAVGAGALAAGALVGGLLVQSTSGAGKLLSASFPDLSGRVRRLSDWRGAVVLFNFWATWCAPCREEMPLLDRVGRKFGASIVGIGVDSGDNIRQYVANVGVRYEILISGPEGIGLMKDLGNPGGGLPFTLILDRQGRIAHRKVGAFSGAELEGMLIPLLR